MEQDSNNMGGKEQNLGRDLLRKGKAVAGNVAKGIGRMLTKLLGVKLMIGIVAIIVIVILVAASYIEIVKAAPKKVVNSLGTVIPTRTASSGSSTSNTAASGTLEAALQIFENLLNDDSHGYSQSNRWGPDFDCSSSIVYSLKQAGFDTGSANTTYDMAANLCDRGWEQLPVPGVEGLQRGDICLNTSAHVEWYLGNGQLGGFHSDYGNTQAGDQGGEADAKTYYDFPWDCILRYTGR